MILYLNNFTSVNLFIELEQINNSNIKKLALKEENIKKKDIINKTKNITSKEKLEKDIILFNQELEVYRVEKIKYSINLKKATRI